MNANTTLKSLLLDLLNNGETVPSRVGITKEIAFQSFVVSDPLNRYITVPGRNVSVPAQIAETMWVLAGRNDTDWLSAYLPQAPKFADDGQHWRAGYGPRLRGWHDGKTSGGQDQLMNVIKLLKNDPATRRAVISLWDPVEDVTESLDIPCNNWLHFLYRGGKLHLNIATRSNDVMWGWSGINFFEWSVLLEIVAKHAGLPVGDLHFNVSSMHLYERHFEKAKRIVEAPIVAGEPCGERVIYGGNDVGLRFDDLDDYIKLWFVIEGEIREGNLRGIEAMRDPLLWSWLWAIAYYWGHEKEALMMLGDLDIVKALKASPKRKQPVDLDELVKRMQSLHSEKSAAYGDSWKKRGELFSIIPNIARKVDRILAETETSDETKLDTAMDLVIYLAKYWSWIEGSSALGLENDMIDNLVQKRGSTTETSVGAQTFGAFLAAAEEGDQTYKREALNDLTTQAVGHLVKLWSGPEGRAMRNEKRSWNPDMFQPGGVITVPSSPSQGLMQIIDPVDFQAYWNA